MKLRLPLLVAIAALLTTAAQADTTLTFDDLGGGIGFIPDGYGGFTWNSTVIFRPAPVPASAVTPPDVASTDQAFVNITRNTPFTFTSTFVATTFNQSVTFNGLVGGATVFSQTFNVNSSTAALETFNFTGITELDILTQSPLDFDNFSFNVGTLFASTPGLTPNQTAIASNIDANSVTPTAGMTNIITALQNLPASSLPAALDQLSPQKFGQFVSSTAFNNASFATEQMDNYLANLRVGPSGEFIGGNGGIDSRGLTVNDPSYDPNLAMVHSRLMAWNAGPLDGSISDVGSSVLAGVDMKDPKDMKSMKTIVPNNPWNFFVQGNVILAQGFSQADVPHFDDNTESVTLGADYRLTQNFLVGLTATYGHTDATLDTDGSSATIDSYSPGFYASYANKGWYANATGNYIHNAYTQSRAISFLGQTATSAPEGNEGVANLDGGYDFHQGGLTYGPLVGLQYTHLTVDGYNEAGSDADLSVNTQDADSLRSRVGGRISFTCSHCGINLTPHLDASWQHEFMDQSRGISSQFDSGAGGFSVRTVNPSRDSAIADAGLDAQINQTVTVYADYAVQAGQDNYFGQSVQAGVKIGF